MDTEKNKYMNLVPMTRGTKRKIIHYLNNHKYDIVKKEVEVFSSAKQGFIQFKLDGIVFNLWTEGL